MTVPSLGTHVQAPRRRQWRLPTRRGRERAVLRARSLNLASAGTAVPLTMAENDPMLLRLAVEDLCWHMAVDDLDRRRPRRGDRAERDAWLAEQAHLEDERRQLATMLTETISAL